MSEQNTIETTTKDKGPAFVAGATGFTGREVVRILVENNIRTVAHVRPDSRRIEQWQDRFEKLGAEVDTTAWEEAAMNETMARIKPAYVFALHGTTRARAKEVARAGKDPKTETYDAIDYGLASILIKAAQAAGSSPRFIYLSVTGVKDNSRSAYYRARAKAERLLRESGLPYIIARPGIITGPGRDDGRPLERLGGIIIDGLLFLPILLGLRKFTRWSSITNTALAKGLVRPALDPASANRIIESEDLHMES